MSLFQQGFGDCRHKAAAAERLLTDGGITAKRKLVRFDWADLPVPADILAICRKHRDFMTLWLLSYRAKHTCLMPPDMALRGAGFPVMPSGMATLIPRPVTSRMSTQQTVLMPQPGQDIYSTNQMSYAARENHGV